MSTPQIHVFVSYSHADGSLVAPVVKLLRANRALVFQDIDSIQPGKPWRKAVTQALSQAQMVVVFWCHHASQSDEVTQEWQTAIQQDKDLLPLLLDATPLPEELGEFQWIDFQGIVGETHEGIAKTSKTLAYPSESSSTPTGEWARPEIPPAKHSPFLKWSIGAFVGILALAVFPSFFFTWQLPEPSAPPTGPDSDSPFFQEFDLSSILKIVIWSIVGAGGLGVLFWWWRRRSKGEGERTHPHKSEQQIAHAVETEIFRRIALRPQAKTRTSG